MYNDLMVAGAGETLLRKLAESEEIEIETRRDLKSPLHRTTIWIVPTDAGVFIRSGSRTGRWYREALANRHVTIRVRRRTVAARVEPESDQSVSAPLMPRTATNTVPTGPTVRKRWYSARGSTPRCE